MSRETARKQAAARPHGTERRQRPPGKDPAGTLFLIGPTTAKTCFVGERIQMDTTPVIRNDRTCAPIRSLAEFFGYTVDWDAATKTVIITG